MRARGADARGVAVIDDRTPESELDDMGRAGVRGIRLNLATGGTNDPAVGRQRLQRAVERMKTRNWHVEVYRELGVIAGIKGLVAASPVSVGLVHFGRASAEPGPQQAGFSAAADAVRA